MKIDQIRIVDLMFKLGVIGADVLRSAKNLILDEVSPMDYDKFGNPVPYEYLGR